jgi:NAD(P)-dependent dehydrogenase (short-subunit alcohol dehydrogenase family)
VTGDARPVALVSGAFGGIGSVIARFLSRDGFAVAGVGRTPEDIEGVELGLAADLTVPDQAERAVQEVADRYGRIDAVVNCAGRNAWHPFGDLDLEVAHSLFDINVWGTVALTRAAYPHLARSPQAAVATVTSTAGDRGIPGTAAYGMTKAALDSLTRTLAVEWAHHPIRVNSVSATIVPTAFNATARQDDEYVAAKIATIPLGRMIEPEEVAEAVAFLVGPRASGITGETLHVDGGVVIRG